MESRVRGNSHARFGERDGRNRSKQLLYGAPVPTLCDPTPSPEDVNMTKLAVQAGEFLGIEMCDHIIVGDQRWVSLKERGLGWDG